ncbi:MAG TPA: hypothetical protein VIX89_09640, partial [Bryobacteraceae bacterium]
MPRPATTFRRSLSAALWLSGLCIPALSADLPTPQYVHTTWAFRNGFSTFPIQTLAQTEDGYLWLGTPAGLWHFDGMRFVEWQARAGEVQLPSQDVR